MSGMEKWKHLQIPFGKIKEATNDFIKETGKGGYGSVYEGHLLINGINTKVAVKRLNEKGQQGLKEFLNEIDLLCGLQHENIITLVGYCDEGNEKIIVYEFAERGSLDYYFRFKNANYTLPWLQRLKIVVDVARGLDHLHNHLPKKQVIIHRDIKTSNILLDHNWVAKISDFGLSKTTVTGFDRSTVVTYACGTPGYVEPELKCYFTANPKSDVYSFGMLLFEVLCGRLCNVPYGKDEERLSAEVAEKYKDKLDNIIDPGLREEMDPNALRMFSAIAYKCLQRREQRPLMNFVKKELEETLKIQGCNYRPTHSMAKWMPLKIPLSDIKVATKDFSKVIARGGFGSMYEGELYVHGIYMKVVVKRSDKEFGQGIKEFLTEIQLLSGGQHENVVNIVGYCDEGKEKITVYRYAKHGSLDRYIKCSKTGYTLSWLQRLKIVVDAASGLDHIHKNHLQMNNVTFFRDIKSANIWLDDKWVAKICHFGFSKVTVTTFNTLPPLPNIQVKFVKSRDWSTESDVYSFGIVLFEVLCGRSFEDNSGKTFIEVAKECYSNNQLDKIIDPILREQMSPNALSKFSTIAYKCLQDRRQRPMMNAVKKELKKTLKIEVLRWRNFISKHWDILDVDNLSSKIATDEKGKYRGINVTDMGGSTSGKGKK